MARRILTYAQGPGQAGQNRHVKAVKAITDPGFRVAPGSRTFHVAELTPAPRGYSIKPGALDTSGLW